MSMDVWIGWDIREREAFWVAVESMQRHTTEFMTISPISYKLLGRKRYSRPTETGGHDDWDVLSGAFMSTDHAIARFFIPWLTDYRGWSLFCDADILVRRNVAELFQLADEKYAVMVVKHQYSPRAYVKKDGSIQTAYPRKNWSSVTLWNNAHPANRQLTLETLNLWTGRALHGFCWLADEEIGTLPEEWNWLVGHSPRSIDPAIVHFTEGLPDKPGYADVDYAEEWRALHGIAEVPR